jgi:hypothetical protein
MNKKKKYLLLVIALIVCLQCIAQKTNKSFAIDEQDWYKKKEVGLNVTGLIQSMVPFNLGKNNAGFVGIQSKYYDKKYAFRISFGSGQTASSTPADPIRFFYGSLGYERRRIVHNRWTYTSGWDFFIGENLFDEIQQGTLVGLSRHYGLEFNINEKCYLSTNAQLLLGLGDVAALKFLYPSSIFFNIRL